MTSWYDRRRTPAPAPYGWHWEVTASNFAGWFARFWLVQDGRTIDHIGFYVPRPKDAWPMPMWSENVQKPRQLHRQTEALVRRYYREQNEKYRIEKLRSQINP